MKKVWVALVAILVTVNVQAQTAENSDRKPNKQERRKQMEEKLQLSEAQKTSMKQIKEEQKTKRDAINNNASLTEEQKQTAIKDLRKNGAQKVDGVLTDEQRKVVKEERKKAPKRDGRRPGRRQPNVG